MTDTAYPASFSPDDPIRRLPWVILIAVLLVLFALMSMGRMLHPPVRQASEPKPLQARIYELPASRGSAGGRPAPRMRHSTVRTPHTQVAHGHRLAHVAIPHVTSPGAAVLKSPNTTQHAKSTPIPHPSRQRKSPDLNWSTLQSQIDTAVNQNDATPPQIHDPHTLVARYYIASVMLKLQRIGDMNNPTDHTGMPVIDMVIGAGGELQQLKLLRSSGDVRLDHDALQIARMSAPFASFPDKLRHKTQHIEVVCYMKFVGYRQLYAGY